MFSSNPFTGLSASIPPVIMQTYVVIMIILVVGGTVYDTLHKQSARYFFQELARCEQSGVPSGRRRGNGVPGGPDRCRRGADVR